MFGIGPTELVVIAVLFLVIFGPSKMPEMARDIGKFVGQARSAIDEFKEELTAEGVDDANDTSQSTRSRDQDRTNGASRHEEDLDDEDGSREEPSGKRERAEYDL